MVICLERGANDLHNAHTSGDATATPPSLASAKSRMGVQNLASLFSLVLASNNVCAYCSMHGLHCVCLCVCVARYTMTNMQQQ